MESVEVSAKSVEEAVQQALIRLGKTRDEVEVVVLSEGHRGILGFVRGDSARVRVTTRSTPGTPSQAVEVPLPTETVRRPVERRSHSTGSRSRAKETMTPIPVPDPEMPPEPLSADAEGEPRPPTSTPARIGDAALVARDTLEELLEKMGIDADVVFRGGTGTDDSPVLLDVEGEDLGILIGRRGETLSSLQFLINLMVGKRMDGWVRVVVDVEGYKVRREEALRALATRVADRVRRTGQAVVLEPMPPNERRIVHMSLQSNPHVATESQGFGEDRRVTVMPRPR